MVASLTKQPDTLPGQSTRLLRLALRLLRRDLGSGRLLVMLIAAVIAVASTVSVSLLVNRVTRMMEAESSALLAGDLALVSREPTPQTYLRAADRHGLEVSQTLSMRSVVAKGESLQLVRLKAVDQRYPLAGELRTALAPHELVSTTKEGPRRGEVWADLRAFQLLELKLGDTLDIGSKRFTVSRLLVLEPDRGGSMFAFAPRVMIHLDDLGDTELIVPGSRVTYNLLLAGPVSAVDSFRNAIDLEPGHSLLDPRTARPEMENAFIQAERFLTLATFVGVLLATIGIALAASAYAEHHHSTVAVLKTLGLSRREVAGLLAGEISLLAALAAACGNALAFGLHQAVLINYLPAPVTGPIPISPLPFVHGAWVAFVVLGGFALPALIQLARLPVTSIFNRDRGSLPSRPYLTLAFMLLAATLIAPWHLGNRQLIALAFSGMLVSGALVALVAFAMVRLLGRLRSRTAFGWRFGLANISRRARLSVLQTTAIGIGIAVVLLLGLIREDLTAQWQQRLPAGAPNQFLINIHDDEVAKLRQFVRRSVADEITFYPMIRGRLSAINTTPVSGDSYAEPRARRLAEREFNLSFADTMKADNRLLAGHWWQAGASGEMSVEQGIAKTLGIALGDTLHFSVAGRQVSARVTSLREVTWENFEVNFFVVTTPELLSDAPTTWITSFYLPADERGLMRELLRAFPSVTVIDIDALMNQVRQVMQRVSSALNWVFLFALLAGIAVLGAAVQAAERERMLDLVLLKTLGAPRSFITRTVLVEFAVLGALAGLLGSLGASATAWALAHYALDLSYTPNLWIILAGVVSGALGVGVIGAAMVQRSQKQSVVSGLRQAAG